MKIIRLLVLLLAMSLIAACSSVNVGSPDMHYVSTKCRYPHGGWFECRVAQWQMWPGVYWDEGTWYPIYWQPWYWNPVFWEHANSHQHYIPRLHKITYVNEKRNKKPHCKGSMRKRST